MLSAIIALAASTLVVEPFLDEARLKDYYRETGAYAFYSTRTKETYTETQNPLAAVLGVYRHENLFADTDFKGLRKVVNREIRAAGLRDDTFGDLARWKLAFARAMKLKDAKTNLVEVKDGLTFQKEAKHLAKWLGERHAALWVREATTETQDDDNRLINGGKPFPLTIALIDGLRGGGGFSPARPPSQGGRAVLKEPPPLELHVVWPRGHDRRYREVANGWHRPEELFYDVKRSLLIYWKPERKLK